MVPPVLAFFENYFPLFMAGLSSAPDGAPPLPATEKPAATPSSVTAKTSHPVSFSSTKWPAFSKGYERVGFIGEVWETRNHILSAKTFSESQLLLDTGRLRIGLPSQMSHWWTRRENLRHKGFEPRKTKDFRGYHRGLFHVTRFFLLVIWTTDTSIVYSSIWCMIKYILYYLSKFFFRLTHK